MSWSGDAQKRQETQREKIKGYKTHTYLSDNLPMIFPTGRCGLADNEMG